ncbi:heme NO-binding domain-containing protein [Vibrio fluvialis]|nr:heme NO-binding domain-containing protein [Vibrio fluvialis]
MKGIIFTEFLELVEDKFGLDVLDQVLEQAADSGVYTSVGSYDHKALVKLFIELSRVTGIDSNELQRVYGVSVFQSLYRTVPASANLSQVNSCFAFIRHVEDYIHVEVKKLYPDAKPPRFLFIDESATEVSFDYQSARCMSHVCLGLLQGCADYFGEKIDVVMEPQSEDLSRVRFTVTLIE